MAKVLEKHIHKLKRIKYRSGNTSFFCVLDCSFKTSTALALGKKSICWRCNEVFIMNEYSLRLSKPHCENCHKPKKIDTTLDEIIVPETIPVLTLAQRLQQTLKQTEEDEI